jgi:hypothetical protein
MIPKLRNYPLIDMTELYDVHKILAPCPEIGEGVHHARHGAICELSLLGYFPDEIRIMINEWAPPNPKKVEDSLAKVFGDGDPRFRNEDFVVTPKWQKADFSEAIQITRSYGRLEEKAILAKLDETSPVAYDAKDLQLTTLDWLNLFYAENELLCIGENFWDREVKSLKDWKKDLRYAHYISPNPFNFEFWGRKNHNVRERRFLITEMDINEYQKLILQSYRLDPFDVQAAVILHLESLKKVRLRSVVYSGGKSLHAFGARIRTRRSTYPLCKLRSL